MAAGLQCWDANGKLIFDGTVQTSYVLGSGETGTSNGSLPYDARLVGRENSFWVCTTSFPVDTAFLALAAKPTFSLKDGILSWTFRLETGIQRAYNRNFIYGVY